MGHSAKKTVLEGRRPLCHDKAEVVDIGRVSASVADIASELGQSSGMKLHMVAYCSQAGKECLQLAASRMPEVELLSLLCVS